MPSRCCFHSPARAETDRSLTYVRGINYEQIAYLTESLSTIHFDYEIETCYLSYVALRHRLEGGSRWTFVIALPEDFVNS